MVNETAMFTVAPTQVKMSGLLGGYYEFTGWAGDFASASPTSTILLDGDKTVTAVFIPNHTMPTVYMLAAAIFLPFIAIIVLRVRKKTSSVVPLKEGFTDKVKTPPML
jgi:hypothetical protein